MIRGVVEAGDKLFKGSRIITEFCQFFEGVYTREEVPHSGPMGGRGGGGAGMGGVGLTDEWFTACWIDV
jgi:hypothetical protein